MYDIGDIFQRFYQAIVQMAGEGNCDADASRIQPVSTASENQIKWLIELSRAVKRTSPMVSPL
ncbi:Uncharacterised protein [Escherichia coli]|uniref:Uncharacterized protein n=1 Tax=Escherichia coli TaxID=562 RepID=A0A376Y4D2_ECOLX|nr:Uncharacterised protein [Escherichia coli]